MSDVPKTVLSAFEVGIKGKISYLPSDQWSVGHCYHAEVVKKRRRESNGLTITEDVEERFALILPPGLNTCSDKQNSEQMSNSKTCVIVVQNVNTCYEAELRNLQYSQEEMDLHYNVLYIKRRYPVKIPLQMPHAELGGVSQIDAVLISTTVHIQLVIEKPGLGKVPRTKTILLLGDGIIEKLAQSVSASLYSMASGDVLPSMRTVKELQMSAEDKQTNLEKKPQFTHDENQSTHSQVVIGKKHSDQVFFDVGIGKGIPEEDSKTVQAEVIREDFAKLELVESVARGDIPDELINQSQQVEPEPNKEDDFNLSEMVEKVEPLDDEQVTCDILLPYHLDECEKAERNFCEEFKKQYTRELVIKTFDDFHVYGPKSERQSEAVRRCTKIYIYVVPQHNFKKTLMEQVYTNVSEERETQLVVLVQPKGMTKKEMKDLLERRSNIKHSPQMEEGEIINISQLTAKRDATLKYVRENKQKREKEDKPKTLTTAMPENTERTPTISEAVKRNVSQDSGFGEDEPEKEIVTLSPDDEKADVLILCHNDAEERARIFKESILNTGQKLKIGTANDLFHYEGIHQIQNGLEHSDKVIIYVTKEYATENTNKRILDWEKAIEEIKDKLIVVVNKSDAVNFTEFEHDLGDVSALPVYFENKMKDMKAVEEFIKPMSDQTARTPCYSEHKSMRME